MCRADSGGRGRSNAADAALRGRFPSDLLVVLFGPVLVVAVALGLGWTIFRAERFRGSVTPSVVAAAAAGLLVIAAFLLWLRRKRRS